MAIIRHQTLNDLSGAALGKYESMNSAIEQEQRTYGRVINTEHRLHSLEEIAMTAGDAVDAGRSDHALILGAGRCTDIPLLLLTERFGKVTLVDVDIDGTEQALNILPRGALDKIELVGADISGIAAELFRAANESADDNPTYQGFIDDLSDHYSEIDPDASRPDLGGAYDFVCSQLVMSQLVSIPGLHLQDMVRERYGVERKNVTEIDVTLAKLLTGIMEQTQLSHVRQVRQLADDGGSVHLADTYAQYVLVGGEEKLLPMVTPNAASMIDADFVRLREPLTWIMRTLPSRSHVVLSNSITPKTSSV